MKSIIVKWSLAAAIACGAMTTAQLSQQGGISVGVSSAEARVGRPATPASVAGVARRTTRRAIVGGAAAGAAVVVPPACARVLVNGVWVCR